MLNVILIHAHCHNPTASGDYAFAGSIAKDLAHEINQQKLNLEIILVSTLDGIPSFERLYGKTVNGKVTIENKDIGVCSLEKFDPINHNVVAFIDAHRCEYTAAHIIKKVISPESKFLCVYNANGLDLSDPMMQLMAQYKFKNQQPGLYDSFDSKDFLVGSAGVDASRFGLPQLKKTKDLPPLTPAEMALIPKGSYGFMYVNFIRSEDFDLIAQYMKLSDLDQYVLIGADFKNYKLDIANSYKNDSTFATTKTNFPHIEYYDSVPNPVMRNMMAKSTPSLISATGIFSTFEAWQDGKLTYYQNLPNNTAFVTSYLIAVKSLVSNNTSLVGCMPQLIIELSNLLFADKPLTATQVKLTANLLSMSAVNSRLIETNQKIIEQVNGKLAPKLLSFINGTRNTNNHQQLTHICSSLKKTGETASPSNDQALRRAAAWDRLFELKVLINSMVPNQLDNRDANLGYTALHWAAKKNSVDCVRALIKAGASLDIIDKKGQTALHKAMISDNQSIVKLLIDAGASKDILDDQSKSPMDYDLNNNFSSFKI